MIYAVAYPKGGVGKTTMSVHLGVYFAKKGKTLLIDGDPQRKASTWVGWRREHSDVPFTTIQLMGNAIFDEGKRLTQDYDTVIVDVAGEDGVGIRNAMLLADKVIAPMGNSAFDVVEIERFIELFEKASAFNRGLECRVLFNKMRGSTEEVEEFIEENNVTAFKTLVSDRRSYAKCVKTGITVMEYKPLDAGATHEMRKLFEEIESWV